MEPWMKDLLWVAAFFIIYRLVTSQRVDRSADIQKMLWEEKGLLVDVRTPGEYSRGHAPGAVNIPLRELPHALEKRIKDKSRPIIVYCHSGARSAHAKKLLLRAGFQNVVNAGTLHRVRLLLKQ